MALIRETIVVDTRVKPEVECHLVFAKRREEGACAIHSRRATKVQLAPILPAVKALLNDGGFQRTKVVTLRPPMPEDDMSGQRVTVIATRS
jgi:hypothetical protein